MCGHMQCTCDRAARRAGKLRRTNQPGQGLACSLRCVKWPYQRRIDSAQAWGMVAVGTAGLVGIPTILATLHATDTHFRWWWPTNWMAVPLVIFLIGVGLIVLPARRSALAAPADAELAAAPTSVVESSHLDHDREPRKPARLHDPAPAPSHDAAVSERVPVVAERPGHAFISYAPEDARRVDQLQRKLEAAGISVWRDSADVWPGEDWRMKIRHAITDNALVFIACFSGQSIARTKSQQNEELILAIDQLRMRRPDIPWLIPVRFDNCQIPDLDLGGGRTLASIQHVDLFGEHRDTAVIRLVASIRQLLGLELA